MSYATDRYISGGPKGEIGAFCEDRRILIFSYTLDPDLSKNVRYPIFWALLCYLGGFSVHSSIKWVPLEKGAF